MNLLTPEIIYERIVKSLPVDMIPVGPNIDALIKAFAKVECELMLELSKSIETRMWADKFK